MAILWQVFFFQLDVTGSRPAPALSPAPTPQKPTFSLDLIYNPPLPPYFPPHSFEFGTTSLTAR